MVPLYVFGFTFVLLIPWSNILYTYWLNALSIKNFWSGKNNYHDALKTVTVSVRIYFTIEKYFCTNITKKYLFFYYGAILSNVLKALLDYTWINRIIIYSIFFFKAKFIWLTESFSKLYFIFIYEDRL